MMEGSAKLDLILMECIQAIEEKGWTIEDCLYRFPDHRQDLEPMLEAAIRLRGIRSLEPSNRFQIETLSRMQLRLKASHRQPKSILFQRRANFDETLPKARILPRRQPAYQWAMSFIVAAFTIIAMLAGFTFVADAAKPGDVLYPVDQAIERIQVRMASSVEGRTKLYLGFASERLDEAFGLIKGGKSDYLSIALQGYEKNIQAAETLIREDVVITAESQQLADVLNETLKTQTIQLQELMALAPTSDLTSIQAAILKISDIQVAMAISASTVTPTHQVIETQIIPEPSGIFVPSPTRPSKITPIADSTPHASATAIPPTAIPPTGIPPTGIPPTAISATPYVSPTNISATAFNPPTSTIVPSSTPTPTRTPSPTMTSTSTSIPLPDLIIEPIGWPLKANLGVLLNLSYRVSNIGTITVGDGFINQLYVDDMKIGFTDKQIGSHYGIRLNPGESDTYGFVWRTTCGIHELYAITDDTHLFNESDENNNSTPLYHILTIDCGTPPYEE